MIKGNTEIQKFLKKIAKRRIRTVVVRVIVTQRKRFGMEIFKSEEKHEF